MKLYKEEKKIIQNENRLRELTDSNKCNSISIIKIPEEEREKGIENIFQELRGEIFPNLGEETNIKMQGT